MIRESVVTINPQSEGRIYEGIGVLSAGASSRFLRDYPEPQRSEILDFLFRPKYGAAFQHLKIEVGGDGNSTLGSEPSHARTREEMENPRKEYFDRGYEWWLACEAKKRNPDIILDCLPWAAAGWVEPFTPDNADYMISFVKGGKEYYGLEMDWVGTWNEYKYDIAYLKLLRRMLDENGLQNVKIVAADEYTVERGDGTIYDGWTIVEDILRDPELAQAVDAIGVHYAGYLEFPMGAETYDSSEAAKATGKPLWSSEVGLNKYWSHVQEHAREQLREYHYLHTHKTGWLGVQEYAKLYNRSYVVGRMTKQQLWAPISAYYRHFGYSYGAMEAMEPWSGQYQVYPMLWATAHTTQFAEPGWRYLDNGCMLLPGGGSCVTLLSPDGSDYSIIVETFGANGFQTLTFNVPAMLGGAPVKVWRSTSQERLFEQDADDIATEGGSFSISLPPNGLFTLTTTTGQCKGQTVTLPSQPFPFPYMDDFQSYTTGQTPKYLSDMEGAFEIIDENGEKCLAQTVESPVLSWGGHISNKNPYTVIGSGDWTDYQISADVCVGPTGYAGIYGRQQHVPTGGYLLKLDYSGQWELKVQDKVLASGSIETTPSQWHILKLVMQGSTIYGYIDGQSLIEEGIEDTTYASGMAGLETGWNRGKFRNLRIHV